MKFIIFVFRSRVPPVRLFGGTGLIVVMLETGVTPSGGGGVIAKRRFDCGGFRSD